MHPDLVKLLDLQEKDLALLELSHHLDEVAAGFEKLDAEIRELERSREQAERNAADLRRERDELEAKVNNLRKQQDRRRQQLEQARHPKEIAALTAEIDLTRSVLAEDENEWVRSAERVTALENEARQFEHRAQELRASQEPDRAALAQKREAIEAERQARQDERERFATGVDRPLRHRYERLRAVRTRDVVVALAGAACGACYTTVPLNRRSQIRAGTLVDWCEACGVILYSAESGE